MEIIGIPESLRQIYEKLSWQTGEYPDCTLPDSDTDPHTFLEEVISKTKEWPDRENLRKGAVGELMLLQGLTHRLKGIKCYVLNSVWLPFGESYRKPDHVLLHPCGLSVIETKYWNGHWNTESTKLELAQQTKALEDLLISHTKGIDYNILPIIYDPNAAIRQEDIENDERYPSMRHVRNTRQFVGEVLEHHPLGLSPLMIECFKEILKCYVMDMFEEQHFRYLLEVDGITSPADQNPQRAE